MKENVVLNPSIDFEEAAEKDKAAILTDDMTAISEAASEENEYSCKNQNTSDEVPSTIDYRELEISDCNELRAAFTEALYIKSLSELKNPVRYGELRDMGLTPKEAYLASGGRKKEYDNRMHMHSAVPKRASGGIGMPEYELKAAKEIFGNLNDSEIIKLYNKVTK